MEDLRIISQGPQKLPRPSLRQVALLWVSIIFTGAGLDLVNSIKFEKCWRTPPFGLRPLGTLEPVAWIERR